MNPCSVGATSSAEIKYVLPFLHELGAGMECWRRTLEPLRNLTLESAFEALLLENPEGHAPPVPRTGETVEIGAARAQALARARFPTQPKSLQLLKSLEYLRKIWPDHIVKMIVAQFPGMFAGTTELSDSCMDAIVKQAKSLELAFPKEQTVFNGTTSDPQPTQPAQQAHPYHRPATNQQWPANPDTQRARGRLPPGLKCYNCRGFGHLARDCPSEKWEGNRERPRQSNGQTQRNQPQREVQNPYKNQDFNVLGRYPNQGPTANVAEPADNLTQALEGIQLDH